MRKVVFTLALCVGLIGSISAVSAEDFSRTLDTYMNQVSSTLYKNNANVSSVKKLIQNYCEAIYTADGFTQDGFVYSAKQSSFVFLLCLNVPPKLTKLPVLPAGFDDTKNGFFKLSSFFELGIQDKRPLANNTTTLTNFCSPEMDLSQCDLSTNIPKLYNMIINDYVNLKMPQLFGYDPSVDIEANANVFSANYFNSLHVCAKDNADNRVYPTTCKQLKKYIGDVKKSLADVQIFRQDKINDASAQAGICDVTKSSYSLLLCGLYGDKQMGLQQFLNLSYNEMFYYRLFATYYTTMIQNKTQLLSLPQAIVGDEVAKRVTTMRNELSWSESAFALTLRMLRDQYSAFPLHIGFLLYQEDILKLGRPLAQIYTPISQLYYTLKNVQKKE